MSCRISHNGLGCGGPRVIFLPQERPEARLLAIVSDPSCPSNISGTEVPRYTNNHCKPALTQQRSTNAFTQPVTDTPPSTSTLVPPATVSRQKTRTEQNFNPKREAAQTGQQEQPSMLDVNDFIADRGGNPEKIKCVLPTTLT